jgi:hypothetical protein
VQGLIEDCELLHFGEGDVIVVSLGKKLEKLIEGRRSVIGGFCGAGDKRMGAHGQGTAEDGAAKERTTKERTTPLSPFHNRRAPHASAP